MLYFHAVLVVIFIFLAGLCAGMMVCEYAQGDKSVPGYMKWGCLLISLLLAVNNAVAVGSLIIARLAQ